MTGAACYLKQGPPYRGARNGAEKNAWTLDDLVTLSADRQWTPRGAVNKSALFVEACRVRHDVRIRTMRTAGEIICEDCGVHVQPQFMECSCETLPIPKSAMWKLRDGKICKDESCSRGFGVLLWH